VADEPYPKKDKAEKRDRKKKADNSGDQTDPGTQNQFTHKNPNMTDNIE
jgi:hypothetical protein